MLSGLKRALGGRETAAADQRGTQASRLAEMSPQRPVTLDGDDEAGESMSLDLSTKRTRQELLTELQQNYREVVGLVRKVDQHLDQQERRGTRLMEIAERLPAALDTLPAIREQTVRLTEAIERLAESNERHADRGEAAAVAQTEALTSVRSLVAESARAEQEVAQNVAAFTTTVDSMSEATRTVGDALRHIQERDAVRERQLAEVITKGSRSMSMVVGFCALMFVAVSALGLLLLRN